MLISEEGAKRNELISRKAREGRLLCSACGRRLIAAWEICKCVTVIDFSRKYAVMMVEDGVMTVQNERSEP